MEDGVVGWEDLLEGIGSLHQTGGCVFPTKNEIRRTVYQGGLKFHQKVCPWGAGAFGSVHRARAGPWKQLSSGPGYKSSHLDRSHFPLLRWPFWFAFWFGSLVWPFDPHPLDSIGFPACSFQAKNSKGEKDWLPGTPWRFGWPMVTQIPLHKLYVWMWQFHWPGHNMVSPKAYIGLTQCEQLLRIFEETSNETWQRREVESHWWWSALISGYGSGSTV